MDFNSIISLMRPEISLVALIVILLVYDLFAGAVMRKYFAAVACTLLAVHVGMSFFLVDDGSLFGGMFRTSPIVSIVKLILSFATLIVFLSAEKWLSEQNTEFKRGEFYVLILSTLFGMYIMLSSGHFLLFYIGLEIASIPLACLVAFDKFKNNSAEAGAKYILSAALSSGILLYGLSFIYGSVGTLYFDAMPAVMSLGALEIVGFVMFLAGMAFKISLVPFHLWTADVYQGAPTQVTAYLSVVSKGAAVFVLMTILFKVFAPMASVWEPLLYVLIITTIVVGNLFAIRQDNIKRFFAFSSISQAGYIVLGIMASSAEGMTSLVYYIFVYVLSNMAAFAVIGSIESHSGKVKISDYNGLYSSNPRLAVVMMFSLFSLAGIPPFAGFFSKFFIFASAASAGYYALVLIALINTIVSLYYYLLVVKAMFINTSDNPVENFKSGSYARVAMAICTAGILLVGIVSCIYSVINGFAWGIY